MKRTAILSICILVIGAGFFFSTDKAEHSGSPAFSAALEQAIGRLEGAAANATAVIASNVQAEALDCTSDPITCDAYNPYCQTLTQDSRPCFTLFHVNLTCDHEMPTCNAIHTCEAHYTCDDRNTCYGANAPTCDGSFTCWSSTCKVLGQTCDGTTPTCDRGAACTFTMDGTHTCNGAETCNSTCFGWPTCNPGAPECENAVQQTSWGSIKANYR